jgi:hypothetical protein
MRNRIDIDHLHSRVICREIGERLQAHLKPEPELPARLKNQADQLREVERQSSSMVHGPRRGVQARQGCESSRSLTVYLAVATNGLIVVTDRSLSRGCWNNSPKVRMITRSAPTGAAQLKNVRELVDDLPQVVGVLLDHS